MTDCCVVGPGAVGGYLGAVLALGGLKVAVVARGPHGEAIARDGLRLLDPQREGAPPARVTVHGSLAEAPPAAAVVLAVKHRDMEPVVAALPEYLARCGPDTAVLALQNGVAHLTGPLTAVAPARTLVGSVYIFSHIAEPGVVQVTGGPRLYRFGPLDPAQPAAAQRGRELAALWAPAGLVVAADDDGRRVCWEKLCLLAPLSAVTAVTGRTVGEFRELPDMMQSYRDIAEEVRRVGVAEGVGIDPSVVDFVIQGIATTEPESRSSMAREVMAGRDSEIEVLLGDVVRRGDALGVPVPALRAVYAATRVRYGIGVSGARPGDPEAARDVLAAWQGQPRG
jgi:2-dehydropantoate 2-reductase